MFKTFKYRLYPTKAQANTLDLHLNLCRLLYNAALEEKREAYRKLGKPLNYFYQQNQLPDIKREFPIYKNINAQVLQNVINRVHKSYNLFFLNLDKGVKNPPRFKSKSRFRSMTFVQDSFSIKKSNKIRLSKIGLVKIKLHREIPKEATQISCTIKKSINHWYCSIVANVKCPENKIPVKSSIGIDLGLKHFITLSNGGTVPNPKFLHKMGNVISKLPSTKKGRERSSVINRKAGNQRKNFHHKISRYLVNTYDLIAYEDLDINGLKTTKYNLGRQIDDAGWGNFIRMLTYKAEEAGKYAVAVDPRGTSQRCVDCGTIVRKTLKEREHNCPVCGLTIDRDLNAAHNIWKLGTNYTHLNWVKSGIINQ